MVKRPNHYLFNLFFKIFILKHKTKDQEERVELEIPFKAIIALNTNHMYGIYQFFLLYLNVFLSKTTTNLTKSL